VGVEQIRRRHEEPREIIKKFPDLAFTAAAESRGVKDNAVVYISPFDFTRDEFHGVVFYPPDAIAGYLIELRVFLRPADGAFDTIQVCHARACFCRRYRSRAGLRKKIEYG